MTTSVELTDSGLPNGFLELAEAIYAGDPHWIPEDGEAIRTAFSRDNPWFSTGKAVAACVPGQCRGAAFVVPGLQIEGKPTGFFGFFESQAEAETENKLFAGLEEWARSQGAQVLYGPINFSTFGSYRIRLSAEPDADMFVGEPYNPADYQSRIERLGYSLHQGYCTQIFNSDISPTLTKALHPTLVNIRVQGYRVEPLTPEIWMERLGELHPLVDTIFSNNFAYTPISFETFERACGTAFANKLCPRRSLIVFAPSGELAAFLLVYPHYGPLVCQGAGSARLRVQDLNLSAHRHLLEDDGFAAGIYKTVGVAPAHRRIGVMEALTGAQYELGVERAERWFGALMRDDNPSVRVGQHFASSVRRYGLFKKVL